MGRPYKRRNKEQPAEENTLRKVFRLLELGIFLGLFVTITIGCEGGTPPPASSPAKRAETKAALPPPVAITETKPEAPAAPPPAQLVYNPEGRRDPFRSILVTTEAGKRLENLPPLQRTELEELRLIAIVWGGFGYSAMVQTPDGKGYTIRVGTLVGPNNGKVKNITERSMTIEEKYTDIFGEKKTREVKLDLHPQKEGSE